MKKFLLSLIFLGMFFGISYADIVYSTSNGKLGVIKISSASSSAITLQGVQYSDAATDSFLSSYRDKDDNNYVILVNRLTSADKMQRFFYNSISSPVDKEGIFVAGVKGTTSVAFSQNGRSLYFATPSGLVDVSTETMTMLRSYDCTPKTSEDVAREVKAVAVSDNRIFALVDNKGESNDVVLMFDGQIRTDVGAFASWEGNNDMTSMSWLSGGRLGIARESGIDILSRNTFTKIVSTDYPVKTLQSDTGDGIFYATQHQSNDVYIDTLSHYTNGTSNFSTVTVNASNSNLQIIRNTDVLGVIFGDEIRLYAISNGNLLQTFTSSQLGGSPISMTIAETGGTSDTSKDNGSGCEVGSLGAISLIFLGMVLKLKRKK